MTGGIIDIHQAAKDGNFDAVKALLATGVSPNTINLLGRTPLHEAAMAIA